MKKIVHKNCKRKRYFTGSCSSGSIPKLFIVVMLVLPFDAYSLTMSFEVGNIDGLIGIT